MTADELNAIRQIMREEITAQISPIKENIVEMKEQLDVINTAINGIGDWVEKASYVVRIPYADTPAGRELLNQLFKEQSENK